MVEHLNPQNSLPQNVTNLVEMFLNECESKGLKPNTLKAYRQYLMPFSRTFNTMPSREQIKTFCDSYFVTSNGNKERAFHHINIFVNWLNGGSKSRRKPVTVPDNETGRAIQAFLDSRANSGIADSSLRWYTGILAKFAMAHPTIPVDPTVLEKFIAGFTSSDERRRGVYRTLRAFYRFHCLRNGWSANPMFPIKLPRAKPKVKIALNLEQIRQLLEFPGMDEDVRMLLFVLCDTGARLSEIATLKYENVLEDSIVIFGKTGSRVCPISPTIREMLLRKSDQKPHGLIFPRSAPRYGRLVKAVFENAGLNGSAHLLRHTYASLWDGSDLSLKTQCGWESWGMVQHYSASGALRKAKEEHSLHSPIAKLYPESKQKAVQNDVTAPGPERIDDLPKSWDYELRQSRAGMLFFWSSIKHNLFSVLSELFEQYGKTKKCNDVVDQFIRIELINLFCLDMNEEQVADAINFKIEQFWRELSRLAKKSASAEYLEASRYRDISLLGEIEIETISPGFTPELFLKK